MNQLRAWMLIGATWVSVVLAWLGESVQAQRHLFAPPRAAGYEIVPARHPVGDSPAAVSGRTRSPRRVSAANVRPVRPASYQQQELPPMGEAEPLPAPGQQQTVPEGHYVGDEGTAWEEGIITEYEEGYIEDGGYFMDGACGDVCYGVPWGYSRLWGRAEYLVWWTQGMNLPPLVTTSDDDTDQDEAGVLGLASTDIVFGNGALNDEARSGGRFTLGTWLDPDDLYGVEASYMFLGEESNGFSGDEDDFEILARPFFNTDLNAEDSRLIVFPNVVEGQLLVDVRTEFEGAEFLYRRAAVRSRWNEIDYYLGYRYAGLDDAVRIDEATTALAAPVAGVRIDLSDQFASSNSFHGGQLGVRMVSHANPWWRLEFLGKFAFGGTRTRTSIAGQTVTTGTDGSTTTATGGLLALPSNIGVFEESEFSTITEFGVTFRGRIQPRVTASFGYTFLYWSDVARVGQQIDTTIDPAQIAPGTFNGEDRPMVTFVPSDFWAQGLNFGLEYRF